MLQFDSDTIVAIATPPGVGGVGVIRISGPLSATIAKSMVKKPCVARNQAIYSDFLSAQSQVIDSGIVIFFKAPNSFTGEDVLELHGHGGPIILNILLKRILELGARLAEPGEFSKRAFLANKLDLVQAESIASLIHAESEQAAIAASKSLQGDFSRKINLVLKNLINIRMHVEALVDFPEDDIDDLAINSIIEKNLKLQQDIEHILHLSKQGKLLHEGIKAVILGKPNVGKSSLLNLLTGQDKAIVTDIPGTTRDLVSDKVNLNGLLVDFIDTAGIRSTDDLIEKIGIDRTINAVINCDLIIIILDYANIAPEIFAQADQLLSTSLSLVDYLPEQLPDNIKCQLLTKKITIFINKIDLDLNNRVQPQLIRQNKLDIVLGSIKNNLGINLLKQQIKEKVGYIEQEPLFVAQNRHIVALQQVKQHIIIAIQIMQRQNKSAWDFLAEELRLAQQSLASITGSFTNEDLLDQIFANFCIGK